jgi:gas vesicle protein
MKMREGYGYEMSGRGDSSQSGLLFFAGLCAGAIVGSGVALLFAPRLGSELREQLADTAARASDAVSKSVDAFTQRGQQVASRIQSTVAQAGEEVSRATDAAAAQVDKGLATLGEITATHRTDWRDATRG